MPYAIVIETLGTILIQVEAKHLEICTDQFFICIEMMGDNRNLPKKSKDYSYAAVRRS
jgi:hypothetical protein